MAGAVRLQADGRYVPHGGVLIGCARTRVVMSPNEEPPRRWSDSPNTKTRRRKLLLALSEQRDKNRPQDSDLLPTVGSIFDGFPNETKGLSAGFFGPPSGRTIHGWTRRMGKDPPELIVRIDNREVGRVQEIGFDHDQASSRPSDRAGFVFYSPLELFDGQRHLVELMEPDSRKVVASRDVLAVQQKDYKDFDSFLRWLYWRRECFAPFSNSDKRCISYMDWLVRYGSSRPRSTSSARPLISIVMAVVGGERSLERPIGSVLQQSYDNWELILVDDGRNASTVQAFKDPRLRYRHSEREQSADESRNIGLSESEGKFVAYLREDSWWHPQYLELMVGALSDNPEYQSVFCGQYLFEESEEEAFALRAGPFNASLIENRNYIDLSAFVHRREIGEAKGPFDVSLGDSAAWDLVRRYSEDESPYFLPCILSRRTADRANLWWESPSVRPNRGVINPQDPGCDVGEGPQIYPSSSVYHHSSQSTDVSVVVPSYNVPDILTTCIEQVVATVNTDRTEIIICDNGSDSLTHQAISALKDKYPNIIVELLDRNYGFSYAANRGIELANPANDIVLLNNDAIPAEGWLSALEAVLLEYPDVGIVAPQQVLFPGTAMVLDHAPFANLEREVDVNVSPLFDNLQSWNPFGPKKLIELTFASFFCVLISREVMDRIGNLDEERGRHYESDRIYCNAVRHIAKKRIVYTWHSKVYHLLQRSTADLRQRDVKAFRAMLKHNDWSDMPNREAG